MHYVTLNLTWAYHACLSLSNHPLLSPNSLPTFSFPSLFVPPSPPSFCQVSPSLHHFLSNSSLRNDLIWLDLVSDSFPWLMAVTVARQQVPKKQQTPLLFWATPATEMDHLFALVGNLFRPLWWTGSSAWTYLSVKWSTRQFRPIITGSAEAPLTYKCQTRLIIISFECNLGSSTKTTKVLMQGQFVNCWA